MNVVEELFRVIDQILIFQPPTIKIAVCNEKYKKVLDLCSILPKEYMEMRRMPFLVGMIIVNPERT